MDSIMLVTFNREHTDFEFEAKLNYLPMK